MKNTRSEETPKTERIPEWIQKKKSFYVEKRNSESKAENVRKKSETYEILSESPNLQSSLEKHFPDFPGTTTKIFLIRSKEPIFLGQPRIGSEFCCLLIMIHVLFDVVLPVLLFDVLLQTKKE